MTTPVGRLREPTLRAAWWRRKALVTLRAAPRSSGADSPDGRREILRAADQSVVARGCFAGKAHRRNRWGWRCGRGNHWRSGGRQERGGYRRGGRSWRGDRSAGRNQGPAGAHSFRNGGAVRIDRPAEGEHGSSLTRCGKCLGFLPQSGTLNPKDSPPRRVRLRRAEHTMRGYVTQIVGT